MSLAARVSVSVVVLLMGVRSASFAQRTTPDPPLIELNGRAFGTTYSVKVAGTGADADAIHSEIKELLEEIDGQMSLWREDSELSQFNRHRGADWFDVSPATADVVAAAVRISQSSEGAFDPTVGPLVRLWSFGADARPRGVPSEHELKETREFVGCELLEVRRDPPALRKLDPRVEVDLNAIAKGFAVDRVAAYLDHGPRTTDAVAYMVEIGGEVRTHGVKPDESPWKIGIERPLPDRRVLQSVVELRDSALATSGDYRNYFEQDGIRYSHTIDPRTGRPIRHSLAAVSVIADDCMTADAWATALMVLGPEEGYNTASELGLAALFLVRSAEGFERRATAVFPPVTNPVETMEAPSSISTFVIAAVVFGIAVAGMAIGVVLSNRRLRGSCGGLSGLKDEHGNPLCEACTNPAEECDEFREQVAAASHEDAPDSQ